MGELTGISPVDWGSLANHNVRVSVGKFEQLLQLLLQDVEILARFTRIYISWYFPSFWANFSQTNFTFSCKIIHFIKSDNQFPSILQNNQIAEAPSDRIHY